MTETRIQLQSGDAVEFDYSADSPIALCPATLIAPDGKEFICYGIEIEYTHAPFIPLEFQTVANQRRIITCRVGRPA